MKIWFKILEKGQILIRFSDLPPSKLKILSKKLMVAYVHIEYSTYQFSELRYRKKRGPERVKFISRRGYPRSYELRFLVFL